MRLGSGRIEVELHELATGEGTPLLLLHALYGSSADWGEGRVSWPGPVYGLDFAGHGTSQWLKGGAYTPEILGVDVDSALRHLGSAALVGAGVGAYVALLVAAARADVVPAVMLLDGTGLAGGGAIPNFDATPRSFVDLAQPREDCDPMLCFLEHDVRPPDYAAAFARHASGVILVEDGSPRPPWWEASRAQPGVSVVPRADAGLAALRDRC